jgi:hypothetical protein
MISAFGVEHEISKSGIMPAIAENAARVPHKTLSGVASKLVARRAGKAKPSKYGFAHANGKVYLLPKPTVRNNKYKAGQALNKLGLTKWRSEVTRGFRNDL